MSGCLGVHRGSFQRKLELVSHFLPFLRLDAFNEGGGLVAYHQEVLQALQVGAGPLVQLVRVIAKQFGVFELFLKEEKEQNGGVIS